MKLILALLLLGLPLFAASVVALTEARDGEEHLLSWPHQLCPPQCIPDKPAHPLSHTHTTGAVMMVLRDSLLGMGAAGLSTAWPLPEPCSMSGSCCSEGNTTASSSVQPCPWQGVCCQRGRVTTMWVLCSIGPFSCLSCWHFQQQATHCFSLHTWLLGLMHVEAYPASRAVVRPCAVASPAPPLPCCRRCRSSTCQVGEGG